MNIKILGILLAIILMVTVIILPTSVRAVKPVDLVYATISSVQEMISTALTPIISSLGVHDTRLGVLEASNSALLVEIDTLKNNSPKALKIYDQEDNYLGVYMSQSAPNYIVFNEVIGKQIQLHKNEVSGSMNAYYKNEDCSGTAYVGNWANPDSNSERILSESLTRHYVLVENVEVSSFTAKGVTYIGSDPSNPICDSISEAFSGYELERIELPFSNPYQGPPVMKFN
jgi:hypothetical protein